MKKIMLCVMALLVGCAVHTNEEKPQSSTPSTVQQNDRSDGRAQQEEFAPNQVRTTRNFVAFLPAGSSVGDRQLDRPTLAVGVRNDASLWVVFMAEEQARHHGESDPMPNVNGWAGMSKETSPYAVLAADGMSVALYDMTAYAPAIRSGLHRISFFGKLRSGDPLSIAPNAGWIDQSGEGVSIVYDQRSSDWAFGIKPDGANWPTTNIALSS